MSFQVCSQICYQVTWVDVDPQDISSLLHDLADMLPLPEDATGENDMVTQWRQNIFSIFHNHGGRGKWRYLKGNYYYWRYDTPIFHFHHDLLGGKSILITSENSALLQLLQSSLFPPPHCDRQWQGLNIRPGAKTKSSQNLPRDPEN